MAIGKLHNTLDTNYSQAYSYRNPSNSDTLEWDMVGKPNPDISGINLVHDNTYAPFGLGSGVWVDTNGRYLMSPTERPVSQFLVINNSEQEVYAGVNALASGQWGIGTGLVLASGDSFEFGEHGTQIIRNVWAVASSGSQLIQGYATNQITGV
jgi:hypothetical protein